MKIATTESSSIHIHTNPPTAVHYISKSEAYSRNWLRRVALLTCFLELNPPPPIYGHDAPPFNGHCPTQTETELYINGVI